MLFQIDYIERVYQKSVSINLQEIQSQRLTMFSFAVTGKKPLPCTEQIRFGKKRK